MPWDRPFSKAQFGPPGGPMVGRNAPHQDVGRFIVDAIEDVQGAGEEISEALDQPPKSTLGFSGPHRIIDGSIDLVLDMVRDTVHKITRR